MLGLNVLLFEWALITRSLYNKYPFIPKVMVQGEMGTNFAIKKIKKLSCIMYASIAAENTKQSK